MFKYLLLIFLVAVFLISGYDWYYLGKAHSAFNTGMYAVLIFWCISMIMGDVL